MIDNSAEACLLNLSTGHHIKSLGNRMKISVKGDNYALWADFSHLLTSLTISLREVFVRTTQAHPHTHTSSTE